MFSKLDMDKRLPTQWRLTQYRDDGICQPTQFPIFVKPEWGQNSKGVVRIDNKLALAIHRQNRHNVKYDYLIQHPATGKIEFEIFIIPNAANINEYACFSITQTCNDSHEALPVNGIYNKQCYYQDLTPLLSLLQKQKIWKHFKQIGKFKMARYGVRADSLTDLINGNFKLIEINLMLPMPLVVLANNISIINKFIFISNSMRALALMTKTLPATPLHTKINIIKI
ncbi:MAG: hypothetical protein KAH18_13315 [Psychromonas sp.]|nr:hypothetical protein [Psychromonas sp.]